MEPVDLAKLETAIKYVERIAEGNNPVNNLPMEEDAVLNNPNVIHVFREGSAGGGTQQWRRHRRKKGERAKGAKGAFSL